MKLATIKSTHKDGTLVITNKEMTHYTPAEHLAATMQHAFDNWDAVAPALLELYSQINTGQVETFPLKQGDLLAPLPRGFQFLDGSVYLSHVELTRKSRGAEMPPNLYHDPLMYQGTADHFMVAHDPIEIANTDWGLDFEAEVVVVTNHVPQGVTVEDAGKHVVALGLINDISLRSLAKEELLKGFGFIHVKPHNTLSPVFVTPDELGDAWHENKLHLPMHCTLNGELFGKCEAGEDMYFDYAQLIHHAAKTRPLHAGTVIGAGTISNHDRSKGSSCIVERRMLETLEHGEAKTPFLKDGDIIRIEMPDSTGTSPFGVIEQKVVAKK